MDRLEPFLLENFFDTYEHRADLINLASSDALPWTANELQDLGLRIDSGALQNGLGYPDIKRLIIPPLTALCHLPDGWSVLPTNGAAEAIALVLHELSADGDGKSIAIPAPGYGAFYGLPKLLRLDVRTYSYQQNSGWKMDRAELLRLAKTCDIVVVVNPHNPTGQTMDNRSLEELAATLTNDGKTLLVDEVFRITDEASVAAQAAQAGQNVIVLGSLSKTYGLPGLRFGWAIAKNEHINRMRTVQHYLSLAPSALTASLSADLLGSLSELSRGKLIRENRQALRAWAQVHASQVQISEPQGGTTVIIEFEGGASECQLFNAFIQQGVLLTPGSKFEGAGGRVWFRLGYATDTELLKEGLNRIIRALVPAKSRKDE
jgi:aspartate/methionine/tyrosine aminotransferase